MEAERQHYGVTLALLIVAGVSFAVMQTLVVPALPFFQREFDTTATSVTWIATGFLLSSSVLTPILGKLGDSYGKKRMLVISQAIFGLASLGAAAAWSLESLIVFRVIQGAGAAVFPLSFGIIRDEFPPEKIGLGIGTVSSVFGVGGGVGLVLSGVIIEHLTWHWLFLIGAVPVLASTVLLAMFVPESPVKTPAKPDYLGGLALSVALGSLLLGISEGAHWGWTSAGVLGLFAVSAVMFYVWAVIENRVPEPMVDLKTFARREMAATNLTTLLDGFRDVLHLHPAAELRADAARPAARWGAARLRLQRHAHRGRPVLRAVVGGDDDRRAVRRRARHADRQPRDAADRHRASSCSRSPCSPRSTTSRGRSTPGWC